MKMRNAVSVALVFLVIAAAAACSKTEPPPQATTGQDSHPVKNVESLPSGSIREGGRTMNRATDLGQSLEQQKQDREKEAENK
jgi:hypothetical protein